MRRILLSILITGVALIATVVATRAYFSDTETSIGNTFTSGTLDLTVDGLNINVVKFSAANFIPGSQSIGTWQLANVGSINGFLDIESISITSNENTCINPEVDAGDVTCTDPDAGELSDLVGLDMFTDVNCDGLFGTGDVKFYTNATPASGIAGNYALNAPINAGANVCVSAQFNWLSNNYGNDNLGQGDDMVLDMTFELAQTAAQ